MLNKEYWCAHKQIDCLQTSFVLSVVAFRYGVSLGQYLFCWPGEDWGSSGLLSLLSAAVPEPQPQISSAEASGLLHLLHPQPGEWGSHSSLSAAEPWLQVTTVGANLIFFYTCKYSSKCFFQYYLLFQPFGHVILSICILLSLPCH